MSDEAATVDTRSAYERAKDAFEAADGESRTSERVVECPQDGGPMMKRVTYTEPNHVKIELECLDQMGPDPDDPDKTVVVRPGNPEHNQVRYGYSSSEQDAPAR